MNYYAAAMEVLGNLYKSGDGDKYMDMLYMIAGSNPGSIVKAGMSLGIIGNPNAEREKETFFKQELEEAVLNSSDKIVAIKTYRQLCKDKGIDCSLQAAKEAVEEIKPNWLL